MADSSGNGNVGTIINGGWGEGKKGSALEMDGGNDSIVRIPVSASLQGTANAVTVMAWARLSDWNHVALFGHDYPFVFLGFHNEKDGSSNPATRAFKWQVATKPDAQCPTGDCRLTIFAPDSSLALNTWYHLAGTFDGQTARLYINGQPFESLPGGYTSAFPQSTTIPMPSTDFSISGYLDNNNFVDEINGRIDDVRVYNRSLSATEIKAIYDETK